MNEILERRSDSVPLHVVRHIDDRLNSHAEKVEKLFSDHTRDEMERYEEILKQIEANNSGAEKRFACLTKKIELHTEQAEKIFDALTEAFPSNKSGKPDFSGHARAHESWIREAADSKELRAYIQKVVLAGIALAVASWAGLLIWQGVLHGPVK